MTLRRCAAAVLALLLGCGSASAPGSAPPTPTVAISTPPAASSSEAAAAGSATATDAEEPPRDCASLFAEAKAADHATVDDCAEMQQKLFGLHEQCDPESLGDSLAWAMLEAAECVEDVIGAHETTLIATLPAAAKGKMTAAQGALKPDIGAFCTQDCGLTWGARCTLGVLLCKEAAVEAAETGTLAFEAANKIDPATHAFDDQAAALCSLPKIAWKDGHAPADCVNKALSMFQRCGDPSGACQKP